ncbi:DUF1877 family protein, partial [Escherichia coli]
LWHLCCSEVSISPLFRWPNSVNHFKDGIDGFLGLTWNQELAATIDRLESLDRNELRKQFSIKRLNEMEIYPGVTFSEELEGQLFASIMLDMEKLISAYRRMLRQGNHALTVIVG